MCKVSIIIPIYNVEEYITECMRSVISQTFCDYEIILVDDCSKDKSLERAVSVLDSSKSNYKVLHHKKNLGLSAARNTGFFEAVGEFVFFLDSDDSISSDCLELLVKKADSLGCQMVVGGIDVIGNGDSIPNLKTNVVCYSSNKAVFNSFLTGDFYMMAWNKLIRRDFLLNNHILFTEGLVHEDYPWSFEVACKLDSIAFVNIPTYNYLVRENSLQTDKDFNRHFLAFKQILREIASIAIHTNHSESDIFLWWFERQKALFFGQTVTSGSLKMQKEMYNVIRDTLPINKFSKSFCHYLFPSLIGFYLYKHFFGYNLC